MRAFKILILLPAFVWLCSCSTELEVNAPYKERKVIYCILNPQKPFQTARISKGFLNEGRSATDIAKNNRDSILFKVEDILVELIEVTPTKPENKKWTLTHFTENNKEEGVFYSPDQLLYKTENIQLDTSNFVSYRYKIRVTNKITGSVSEASSNLVGRNFRIVSPFLEDPKAPLNFRFSSKTNSDIKVVVPVNSAIVEAVLSWNVRLIKTKGGINDTSVEIWKMTSPGILGIPQKSDQATGIIGAGEFWRFLDQEVTKRGNDSVTGRRIIGGDLELTCANEEYRNYREVNGNYNPITQSSPIYTNVSNGLGIVCSQNQKTFKITLDRPTQDSILLRVPQFKLIR